MITAGDPDGWWVVNRPASAVKLRNPDVVSFRYRKSLRAGQFRATLSRSGVSYSAGAAGFRVTRRAGGRGTQATFRTPVPGLSFTTTVRGDQARVGRRTPVNLDQDLYDAMHCSDAVPRPRGMTARRITTLAGATLTAVGLVVPPLLLVAVPLLAFGGISLLRNLRTDRAWFDRHGRLGR